MRSRKLMILAILAALACALCACRPGVLAPRETPAPTPVPTPTPTPTPVPEVALSVDTVRACFLEGFLNADVNDGANVTLVENGLSGLSAHPFAGRAVMLAYLDEPEPNYDALRALLQKGACVYVYAARGQEVPKDIPHLVYRDDGAAEAALDAALAYPPHDTPVRLFGLFSSDASRAYAVWNEYAAAGKVFVKSVYHAAGNETALPDWLTGRLSKYYPGMLDGIYAETAELAVSAVQTLQSAGRSDIEVFSAEVDDALLACMLENPGLLVSAVGANPLRAGNMLRSAAYTQLIGILPVSRELLPERFSAATLADDWAGLADG